MVNTIHFVPTLPFIHFPVQNSDLPVQNPVQNSELPKQGSEFPVQNSRKNRTLVRNGLVQSLEKRCHIFL